MDGLNLDHCEIMLVAVTQLTPEAGLGFLPPLAIFISLPPCGSCIEGGGLGGV